MKYTDNLVNVLWCIQMERIESGIEITDLKINPIWFSLIDHYEVIGTIPSNELFSVYFVECRSRVLKIKCGHLMCFKRPVPAGDDFYIIPGFTRFAVNRKGVVKNLKSGELMKEHIGPYGYPKVPVYDPDKKKWRTIDVHLLVARTFIKNNDPYFKPYVNHINGNKKDYRVENLEWVSGSDNNYHAFRSGLRLDNRPCKILDTVTGKVSNHHSLSSGFKHIGCVGTRPITVKRDGVVYPSLIKGRYEVKYETDKSPWFYDSEEKIRKWGKVVSTTPVQALNLKTNEVFETKTVTELAKIVGISPESVRALIRSEVTKSCRGWLFRDKSNDPWPVSYIEKRKSSRINIIATKVDGSDVKREFESLYSACHFFKRDKKTVKSRLSTGEELDGWILKYA